MATQDFRDIRTGEREIRVDGQEVRGADRDSRSMGQLLRDLSEDASTLVRKEIALAKNEIGEKVTQIKSGFAELGIGAVVMLAGLIVLLQAAVFGLTMLIGNEALSALIVGGIVLLIGAVLLGAARKNLRAGNLTPERAMEAARRDSEMMRDHGDRAVAEAQYARERVRREHLMATKMTSLGSDTDKSPEQLEREINQTRDHVDETVRVLVDRFSPGQIVDQTLDYVRRSDVAGGARTFAYNLGSAIRDNPVPAVMITAGFIWLATGNRSRGHAVADEYDYETGGNGSLRESLGEWSESMGDRASSFAEGASDKASALKDRASALKDRASDTVHRLKDRGRDLSHRSRDGMDRARHTWSSMLDEQPLVLGLAGVVIGALIGAALPATEQEDEWMGETRDRALAKASEAGREVKEEVKEQVQELTKTADQADRRV